MPLTVEQIDARLVDAERIPMHQRTSLWDAFVANLREERVLALRQEIRILVPPEIR